jgi:hypothetical protein
MEHPVFDADVRVVIVVAPSTFVAVDGGMTKAEVVALEKLLSNLATDEET